MSLCHLVLSVLLKHGKDVLPSSKNELTLVLFNQLEEIGDLGVSDWIVHENFHCFWRVLKLKANAIFEFVFDTIELILINLLFGNKEVSQYLSCFDLFTTVRV